MEFSQFWVLTSLGGSKQGSKQASDNGCDERWQQAYRVKTEICCVPDLVWRALCEIKRWICHIGCVDGVLWEFCTFLRSLRRLNASVETVSGAISAVSTVQSANFTIFHFCRVWKKVVFSVKSWGTRKLYHVQEHTFGYLLVFFLSIFVKNWSF